MIVILLEKIIAPAVNYKNHSVKFFDCLVFIDKLRHV